MEKLSKIQTAAVGENISGRCTKETWRRAKIIARNYEKPRPPHDLAVFTRWMIGGAYAKKGVLVIQLTALWRHGKQETADYSRVMDGGPESLEVTLQTDIRIYPISPVQASMLGTKTEPVELKVNKMSSVYFLPTVYFATADEYAKLQKVTEKLP